MDKTIIPIPHKRIKDITGQKFGRLFVLGYVGTENELACWLCRCDCGNEIVTKGTGLRYGSSKSCGCWQKERFREAVDGKTTTHGMANKIPEYGIWKNIRTRCLNPNNVNYPNYGGRGIKLCDRWHDFSAFLEDMGRRPSPKMTLDRIDNDGDYSPENCRWATPRTQCNNQRRNVRYTHNGETLTVTQWARRIGMNPETLRSRLKKGMPFDKAISIPINENMRR